MTGATKIVRLEDLGIEVSKLFKQSFAYNKKYIVKQVTMLPARFERACKQYMMQVFENHSGARGLIGSAKGEGGVTDVSKNQYEIKMVSEKEYANIQHWGGVIPAHWTEPKHPGRAGWAKALHWVKGGIDYFSKGHEIPAITIRPQRFFEIPMKIVANKFFKELVKYVGFG